MTAHPRRHRLAVLAAGALAITTVTALPIPSAQAAGPMCGREKATIVGTSGNDVLKGTPADDVIVGLGGNDRINGLGGGDSVCAGPGDDVVLGGAGPDYLFGEGGADVLRSGPGSLSLLDGGDGDDTLTSEDDANLLVGRDGDDSLSTEHDLTTLQGGPGDDRITGGPFPDEIAGGGGKDVIDAGGGIDEEVDGGLGNDRIDGGDGSDTIRGGGGHDRLTPGTGDWIDVAHGGPGNDLMWSSGDGTNLLGEKGDDELRTTHDLSMLDGGPGADIVTGGPYDDILRGGPDNDRLEGGAGDDHLAGADGNDRCSGGTGTDVCDGGSPGGPENTPEDPDVCDDTVEQKTSCRGKAGFPDRWQVHVEGVWSDHHDHANETGGWTMDFVLRRGGKPDETWYVLESATGSWHIQGSSNDGFTSCSWGGSGGFDPDYWGADITLVPEESLYFLDFGGSTDGFYSGECHNKDYSHTYDDGMPFFRTWEDTGEAELVPWDPGTLQMTGSESHTIGGESWTQTWTVTPYDE